LLLFFLAGVYMIAATLDLVMFLLSATLITPNLSDDFHSYIEGELTQWNNSLWDTIVEEPSD
jgi:hypothetical protein